MQALAWTIIVIGGILFLAAFGSYGWNVNNTANNFERPWPAILLGTGGALLGLGGILLALGGIYTG